MSVSATCLIKNLKQWSLRPDVEFDQGKCPVVLFGLVTGSLLMIDVVEGVEVLTVESCEVPFRVWSLT